MKIRAFSETCGWVISLLVTLIAMTIAGCNASERTKKFSVCEVLRSARELSGKAIEIKAEYETDGMHFTQLVDTRCSKAGAISVSVLPEFIEEASILELRRKTFEGEAGTLDKRIVGSFHGRFRFRPHEFSEFELELQHVSNLEVFPRIEVDVPLPKEVVPYN